MIRLSEAMARLSCKDEVQPKHVKEAFRLLNKSIIRVETPDINFDDEEQQQNLENGMIYVSSMTVMVFAKTTVEPLIKDTPNKEHLSIKAKSTCPNS